MSRHFTYAFLIFLSLLSACKGSSSSSLISITLKDGTVYPTLVATGSTVTAYFTVTNNSPRTYSNVNIHSLPENVVQVTSEGTYTDTCASPATLTAQGSCTLELTISGAVATSERIIGCLSGNLTCATRNPPAAIRELSSIEITPDTFDADLDATQQFTATGTFEDDTTDDITSEVTWVSSNTDFVTITDAGLATVVASGAGTVTATYDILTSNEATFVVGVPLSTIHITPTNATDSTDLITNPTEQFTAMGLFEDLSEADLTSQVTWESSDPTIATISEDGLVTGLAFGSTNISATLGETMSDIATYTVEP